MGNGFIPEDQMNRFKALLNNAQIIDYTRESKQESTLFDVAKEKFFFGFYQATEFFGNLTYDIHSLFFEPDPAVTYGRFQYRADGTKRPVSEAQDMAIKYSKNKWAETMTFVTKSASGSDVKEAWLNENADVLVQAAGFFTESLGVSMSVGGPLGSRTAGTAAFFMYGVNGIEEQMLSEDFDNLSIVTGKQTCSLH